MINIKTSRAQILKAATEYIRFMRSKNTDYQKDIDVLKKQNTDIESQSISFFSFDNPKLNPNLSFV